MTLLTNVTPIRLTKNSQGQLTQAPNNLYTSPVASYTKIQAVTCSNITSSPVTITLHIVPSGGSLTSGTQVVTNQTVPANGSYIANELLNHILHPGDQIFASASSGKSINITMSGTLIS
jgi:hypothetical protein